MRAWSGRLLLSTSSPRSGAVCGLAATRAVLAGAWEEVFVWLGIALVIDGIDGTFARMARRHRTAAALLRRAARPGRRLRNLRVRARAGLAAGGLFAGMVRSGAGEPHPAVVAVSFFRHREQDRGSLLRRLSGDLEYRRVLRVCLPDAALAGRRRCSHLCGVHVRADALGASHAHADAVARHADGVGGWSLAAIVTLWSGFPAGWAAQLALAVVAAYGIGLALARSLRG